MVTGITEMRTDHQQTNKLSLIDIETDLSFLKTSIIEEKTRREHTQVEHGQAISQLQQHVHGVELTLAQRLQEQAEGLAKSCKDSNLTLLQNDTRLSEKIDHAYE
jgi:N-acetylglutamate synthase/N-acetylornithine aminotransferase